ncbi:PspC domain-containing protein [Saccharomonospora glauca]|jgi:phage shock protein PspC (stress-responsive transcriptional regulator)|uniref:Putative stress-responsive transcriptional regulator n=1 Tax=Saccharomonospora glauca K62 TaxID=928724 RepID=I1D597_9PSEU|nr:PspC domain-containing protein [Saccharomonospora glauca]EIF00122.1 putative stress-responsive transcriptional regulator [Saccharomonospora glauca K62]
MATITALTRPSDDRMIAGVCAGLARHYGWKPGRVRLAFLVSCLLPGPQFLLYLALWLVIPSE